jgi:predicted kinase
MDLPSYQLPNLPTHAWPSLVVVSGLPGSGKTTLGRRLANALSLPLIDKDDILDRLFETKGVGDAAWRRMLSRESDVMLQREATASNGAVLVSFWWQPGMREDSGTPTSWIAALSMRTVHIHCVCAPEVAAGRFLRRTRHPGHLDGSVSPAEIRADLQALSALQPIDLGRRIDVDTSGTPELNAIVLAVQGVWGEDLP